MSALGVGDIERIAALMQRYGIAAFDYEADEMRLRLVLDAGLGGDPEPEAGAAEPEAPSVSIASAPGVGFFLLSHPADPGQPAQLPRKVERGDILGYIKSGPTLRAVRASVGGAVMRPLLPEGGPCGYGDGLFEIMPDGLV